MNDSSKNLRCINFYDVKQWSKVEALSSVEQLNIVILPKQMHGPEEVVKAKLKQLHDWNKFEIPNEVEDLRQEKMMLVKTVLIKSSMGCKEILGGKRNKSRLCNCHKKIRNKLECCLPLLLQKNSHVR